ncbi:MAG: hypothetical protein KKC05_03290, partial [Nanoarchaeota archaeon]|nr:hypothetical protein [Nanoarchaeota archaeon]
GVCGSPFEMETVLDYTSLRGSGSNLYYSLVYQAPKWAFKIKKVDEWMEVTPTYAEYYNITVAQKQKIEGAIKSGLASTSQAVADYELLSHDARRYKEILEYFKKAKGDDHVLRSLFIDRIDAHTGEGYSMVTMARRWPTIITDFIRMKSEWTDPEKIPSDKQVKMIMGELDVSQAEATVLKTKNELYLKWKEMFFPVVKDRYARIEAMVRARKKSIDEYKNWLKPYIARYRMIKEKTEENPSEYLSNPYVTPGFGQSQATTGVRVWMWKPFYVAQKGKPEAVIDSGNKFVIDPLDDTVKEWIPKINKRYNLDLTEADVRKLMDHMIHREVGEMDPHQTYYVLIDIKIKLDLLKTPPPQGVETDNIMFEPVKAWVMSQNAFLLHMIEIHAREKSFENYVHEILGTPREEKRILEEIEEDMEGKPEKKPRRGENIGNAGRKLRKGAKKIFHVFVKKGPYDPVFKERVSKMYMRNAAGSYTKVTGLITSKMLANV